jgi:hypothetical protein
VDTGNFTPNGSCGSAGLTFTEIDCEAIEANTLGAAAAEISARRRISAVDKMS